MSGRLPDAFILVSGGSQVAAKTKTAEQKAPKERENLMNSLNEACRAYWRLQILLRRSYRLH